MTVEECDDFLLNYFERRKVQLGSALVKIKKPRGTKETKKETGKREEMITLTKEQLDMLRKLGLC